MLVAIEGFSAMFQVRSFKVYENDNRFAVTGVNTAGMTMPVAIIKKPTRPNVVSLAMVEIGKKLTPSMLTLLGNPDYTMEAYERGQMEMAAYDLEVARLHLEAQTIRNKYNFAPLG